MIQNSFPKKKHFIMLAMLGGSLAGSASSYAGDLYFSGFMSIGGGFVTDSVEDGEGFEYNGFYEDDIQFNRNIFGLQLTGDISDKLSATAQLITRSEDDYEITAEWAYMSWAVSDDSQIRFGRLRTPFYLYSDYLDVGYSYSWVRPPREVYYLPVNNIDGVDFYTTGTLGPLDTSLQAYFGGFDGTYDYVGSTPETPTELNASTRNQLGLAVTLGQTWWNFRLAYHQADFTLNTDPIPEFQFALSSLEALGYGDLREDIAIEDDSTTFLQFGLTIDTDHFVAAAEHIEFETDDAFLPKAVRDYVMLGVRFNNVLIHGTYSMTEDERKELENLVAPDPGNTASLQARGILAATSDTLWFNQDVVTIGVRWDVTTGAALKFQIDQIDRTDEDPVTMTSTDVDQTVVTFAIQSVF
ncbi:hypothetical protein TDB9533_00977 [Thalassocella blandensis]|nr:hypothetical protein TDB9533_00977 [Thalassocella blandensis]